MIESHESPDFEAYEADAEPEAAETPPAEPARAGTPEASRPFPAMQPQTPSAPAPLALGVPAATPHYLQSLIDAGALTEADLQGIPHRVARVAFAGEVKAHDCALAHLAPDAVATMRRRVGSGHITGTISYPAQAGHAAGEINFALLIEGEAEAAGEAEPADPRTAALEAQLARLERRLTEKTPIQRMGEEWVLAALEKAMNPAPPPDPMVMLDQTVKQLTKMAGMAGTMRDKLAPLVDLVRPAVAGKIEDAAQDGGIVGKMIERGIDWITQPGNLIRAVQMARGEFTADETFVDGEVADAT